MADKTEKAKSEERSAPYVFYRTLFPSGKMIAAIDYETLKEHFPLRFDFNIVNQVFSSFMETKPTIPNGVGPIDYQLYVHDKVTYRATMECVRFKDWNSQAHLCLTIRLANDGFLYPKPDELAVFRQSLPPRHGSATWCQLDKTEMKKFPILEKFCRVRFGIAASTQLKSKLFYNFEEDRFDFSVMNDNGDIIKLCFEPGYPETDFADYWL